MVTQTIDAISFNMKEAHDFSFLSRYGEVFCAFSQNDSGNISFGVVDKGNRHFIKIAGAKTAESCRNEQEAVDILKKAMPIYKVLEHPNLIELVDHYSLDDLYIAVFKWSEGECLFDHWNFDMYASNPHLLPPKLKFMKLPIEAKLASFRRIFEFLTFAESKGYIAVDFYDGSIMHDFANNRTTICDIDFFRKAPTTNDMGEDFWGTKRLKAPEEYMLGSPIDSITNVYTLGALVLHFFGVYSDGDIGIMYKNKAFFPCEFEGWQLNHRLYDVALTAVNLDRTKRYQSLSDFSVAWNSNQ